MSKLTHESLRQMISEEISKLEASKSEPKSVKVTAKQLRGIILQEVNSLNETPRLDRDDPDNVLIAPVGDPYEYMWDELNKEIWVIKTKKAGELPPGKEILMSREKLGNARYTKAMRTLSKAIKDDKELSGRLAVAASPVLHALQDATAGTQDAFDIADEKERKDGIE